MNTTTAVFNTLKTGRGGKLVIKRTDSAEQALRWFSEATDVNVAWMAQGIDWADRSCRIDGTLSLGLRKMTAWQIAGLIRVMLGQELTMNDVPRWLVENRHLVLS